MVYIHLRCMKFKNNVYLDLYNTGFTISFLSKVRAICTSCIFYVNTYMKLLHQVLYPYIKTINMHISLLILSFFTKYSCVRKVMSFNLTFSIDYYTAMCIYVYLCYIHRVNIEGICPYMKKLQGAWEIFLVL